MNDEASVVLQKASMAEMKEQVFDQSPLPSLDWTNSDRDTRSAKVINGLPQHFLENIRICSCEDNGYVYVEFVMEMTAAQRGSFLLDLEFFLKENIDQAITIWHAPQGDRSSLRRLRGIGVKS